ncbi:MAG: hypothetical protein OEV41_07040 [Gammaproteobacteria bacterium]|nr:hypothetical protein [Gammaproteobacteria bacterium]MDH5344472.1 hypothetical protein [Gammaproteobacteria bacterium]
MNERPEGNANDDFATKAKARFDESVARIDGATQSKLTRARHEALAELAAPRPAWAQWVPATGVAAAAVLAVVMWTGGPSVNDLAAPEVASDMEILLTEDSLEMLEDLEFYSWIDLDEELSTEPENHVG